ARPRGQWASRVFFFSSRRRHTSFSRDWSSDVCSSDLDGAPAKLKGDLWKNADDFKALQDRLMSETAKLPAAAANLDDLRKQLGATGASCKACHDKYRNL